MALETYIIRSHEELSAVKDFTVLKPLDFARDFTAEAKNARQRVWVRVMIAEQGHAPGLIINSLMESARKGVDTRLTADSIASKVSGTTTGIQKELNERMLNDLERSGVQIKRLNPPTAIQKIPLLGSLMGRNHVKFYIVDGTAWIGGLNLENANYEATDFMVKIKDPLIVNALAREFHKTMEHQDSEIYCNSDTKIITDSGKRGKSLILDEATELVRNAKDSVHAFSLLLPDGKFVSALEDARKRGIDLSIITTTPDKLGVWVSRNIQKTYEQFFNRFHSQIPLIKDDLVHAKLLIVDGKSVLFGSHNLSALGVLAGTAEIALFSQNPRLVGNLEEFFQSQVARIKAGRKFAEED